MDHKEFLDLYDAMVEKIKASGVRMKGYGSPAYDMAEKEHIRLHGIRKYASHSSFMSCRANNKPKDNEKPDFVPVFKKKRQPVFKRTEFDSKFNWLF